MISPYELTHIEGQDNNKIDVKNRLDERERMLDERERDLEEKKQQLEQNLERQREAFFKCRQQSELLRKAGRILKFDLNLINRTLPYCKDNIEKIWFIDTGSAQNCVNQEVVNPNISRIKEDFVLITRKRTGIEYIIVNLKDRFGVIYLFKFSDKYNVLLGSDTMRKLKVKVYFDDNVLVCNGKKIDLSFE